MAWRLTRCGGRVAVAAHGRRRGHARALVGVVLDVHVLARDLAAQRAHLVEPAQPHAACMYVESQATRCMLLWRPLLASCVVVCRHVHAACGHTQPSQTTMRARIGSSTVKGTTPGPKLRAWGATKPQTLNANAYAYPTRDHVWRTACSADTGVWQLQLMPICTPYSYAPSAPERKVDSLACMGALTGHAAGSRKLRGHGHRLRKEQSPARGLCSSSSGSPARIHTHKVAVFEGGSPFVSIPILVNPAQLTS